MFAVALKMLLHNKARSMSTLLGIAVAFFLSAAQLGLLVGWCNTTTAIIRHADADVWVMAEQTQAFDYGTPIPGQRLYQTRSVPGTEWAEALYIGWQYWQHPGGRQLNMELVGLDDDLVGGPWRMSRGSLDHVLNPDYVIVDELYADSLGVQEIDDAVEIVGHQVRLAGYSEEVRTFTAAPFVFTSLKTALQIDQRYRPDEITYVMARCADGVTPAQLRDAISAAVPDVEVATSDEFAIKTVKYWMLETGIGITVVTTAVLGLLVGTVIVSQTLYAITNDHRQNYATLLAIGFERFHLIVMVVAQSIILGLIGVSLGAALFACAANITASTPIPLETTPAVFSALIGALLCCCIAASLLSVRTLFRIDPVTVFHA